MPLTDPTFTRRGLLTAAGVGAGLALVPPASASSELDRLWGWTHRLAAGGPRLTGNTAHRHYIDWLADQFERTGLKVHRDRHSFTRWAPKRWSLRIAGERIDVAFYFPYSGQTPPGGVTA